jgi:hypothetical protein
VDFFQLPMLKRELVLPDLDKFKMKGEGVVHKNTDQR